MHLSLLLSNIVHTTGINWESVGAIGAIMAVLQSFFVWLVTRKDQKREDDAQAVKQEIADSVNHLSEVLLAKLETKETVSRISERLSRVEGAAGIANRP
jgi:hypothetical protein